VLADDDVERDAVQWLGHDAPVATSEPPTATP